MNDIKIFNNSEYGELSVLMIDGKEYFPATECAEILGYSNPRKAIIDHCKGVTKCDVLTKGGKQERNFITEGDLYRLIIKSQLPSAEHFERWVFDEVLPSIRKHGLYATEYMLDNPDFWIQAFTELKFEREKRKVLEVENAQSKQLICELQPKASYYDIILQNKSLMPISHIAKDYGMSGTAFNKMLHDLGIQFKLGDCWLLYQDYANHGYTQSKTHVIDANRSVMHTYWTQKGRLFLYDMLKKHHAMVPSIDINEEVSA
jgi:prophage antirepressor-like protein